MVQPARPERSLSSAAICSTPHAHAEGAPRRREVVVSGKRVKTVDIHAHCAFPEVNAMMGVKIVPAALNETP